MLGIIKYRIQDLSRISEFPLDLSSFLPPFIYTEIRIEVFCILY
nr:MAG TPA: hypothetical protein [Caudoviricetes sp.]